MTKALKWIGIFLTILSSIVVTYAVLARPGEYSRIAAAVQVVYLCAIWLLDQKLTDPVEKVAA